jgi:uncharacterized protein
MTQPIAASLPVTERLPTLDILRGFALMGILIMNMPGFSSSLFAESDGSHLWPGQLDQLAEQVRDMLFSGKFNGMFSLLFGLGFTIQFTRMQQRDPERASGLYLRRLLVLLVLGVIHACVFWPGDILHMYAILGLVMVLGLRQVSDRTLLWLMLACLLYGPASGALRLTIMSPEVVAAQVAEGKLFDAASNAAYGHGNLADTAAMSTRIMLRSFTDPWWLWGMFGSYVMIAMTMLMGMYAGRRNWARRIPELMPHVRRAMWWALALGLLSGAAFTVIFELNRMPGPSPIKILAGLCYRISRLALMVFYVLAIVRLAQLAAWRNWLAPLAAAGRMPLTNYLMQTAICIVLFYGWGFGLWGKMGPALGLLLALAIFWVVQVPWSLWWLRLHDRGPLEVLWARLTYGPAPAAPAVKPMPM